jgi:hypothetical protein
VGYVAQFENFMPKPGRVLAVDEIDLHLDTGDSNADAGAEDATLVVQLGKMRRNKRNLCSARFVLLCCESLRVS